MYTAKNEGIMPCDEVRKILVEREDSISKNWRGVLKNLGIKSTDQVGFDMFMKIYKAFRLA